MNVSGRLALEMLVQGIRCWWQDRPLSVSFEITHYCTANCWHCNWGGPVKGEQRRTAEEYAAICREMKPVVVNISGGEPLARNDVYDVVRAMANPGHLPWMVLVTNAAALTESKYHRLREAGVNQFSISLDFPDERHSEFRRIPGLFDKMNRVIPQLTALGHDDVSLNSCITAWNFRDVPAMVELAERWNSQMNLSVYTPIRVNDLEGLPAEQAHAELREVFQRLVDMKRAGKALYNSERVLWKYYDFLTTGQAPGCEAGRRFLVVNPDGRMTPCAMVMAYYETQRDMLQEFTPHNTCEMCYISTRANAEKTLKDFVVDNWELLLARLPWRRKASIA
jgi:MoaA/NifB/PqqE/SkfB family radical SAM enzyme